MTALNIAHQRLQNQHIAGTLYEKPGDVVKWLGAVQAQDYAAAKWAVGLRLQAATDSNVEQAVSDGAILRTHIMRPTWHFVSPADIRWLLTLTAPRINALNAYYYRRFDLDDAVFRQSNAVFAKALQGGKQFTRPELVSLLQQAGIATDAGLRTSYIVMRAELDGILCSGARRGKQFTYALLDERAPHARTLERDEALAECARRYFTSHGPATLQDFVWWSGLALADARAGLSMVASQCVHEVIDGQTYWFSASALPTPAHAASQKAHLLPNFDEYMVGYTNRSAVFDASHTQHLDARSNILFNHTVVLHGQVVGTWKRTQKKDAVILTPTLFTLLNDAETAALTESANRYGAFLEMPASICWQDV